MTQTQTVVVPRDRSPAQFFFEVGYGACWAEAYIRNGCLPPFPLTDATVDHAWDIAGEAHDDPEEFDRYLEAASPTAMKALVEALGRIANGKTPGAYLSLSASREVAVAALQAVRTEANHVG